MAEVIEFKKTDTPGPKLVEMVARERTPQERIAGEFLLALPEIEDFVILVHTKDNRLFAYPCVDGSIGLWPFVDAVRAKVTEAVVEKLTMPLKPATA